MKILLKQRGTNRFVGPTGKWVAQKEAPMEFQSSSAAIDYALSHRLQKSAVVLMFPDGKGKYDVELPLSDEVVVLS